MLSSICENLPNDLFGFDSSVVRCGQGHIVRQPDVKIETILNVFRKELLLEVGSNEAGNHQKYERNEQDDPLRRDLAPDQPGVEAVKASLSLLLNRELFLF